MNLSCYFIRTLDQLGYMHEDEYCYMNECI